VVWGKGGWEGQQADEKEVNRCYGKKLRGDRSCPPLRVVLPGRGLKNLSPARRKKAKPSKHTEQGGTNGRNWRTGGPTPDPTHGEGLWRKEVFTNDRSGNRGSSTQTKKTGGQSGSCDRSRSALRAGRGDDRTLRPGARCKGEKNVSDTRRGRRKKVGGGCLLKKRPVVHVPYKHDVSV